MEEIPFDQQSSFYRRHDSTAPRPVARPVDRRRRPVARPVDRSPSPTRTIFLDRIPRPRRVIHGDRGSPGSRGFPDIRNPYRISDVNYDLHDIPPLEYSIHSPSTSPRLAHPSETRSIQDSTSASAIGGTGSVRPWWETQPDEIFRYCLNRFDDEVSPGDLRIGESMYPTDGRRYRPLPFSFLSSYDRLIAFNNTIYCNFDLQKQTYLDLFELIRINGNCYIQFNVTDGEARALGPGSTRQVYKKCMFEMLDTTLLKTNGYFMDINEDHEFWKPGTSCEMIFALFIAMCIKSDFTLPYHLPPVLLKLLSRKDMSEEEVLFYANKLEPDAVDQTQVSLEVFKELDTGYDTQHDFYKSIIHSQSERKLLIYKTISDFFMMFGVFNGCQISKIDNILSGPYTLTPEMVLSMMHINAEQHYKEAWQSFVRSLTEAELKQLLITLGNTISTRVKYEIFINNCITVDVSIQTCQYSLSIKPSIFDNAESLANIKCYLMKDEKIRG